MEPVLQIDNEFLKAIEEKLDAHIKATKQEILSTERWIVKEKYNMVGCMDLQKKEMNWFVVQGLKELTNTDFRFV